MGRYCWSRDNIDFILMNRLSVTKRVTDSLYISAAALNCRGEGHFESLGPLNSLENQLGMFAIELLVSVLEWRFTC